MTTITLEKLNALIEEFINKTCGGPGADSMCMHDFQGFVEEHIKNVDAAKIKRNKEEYSDESIIRSWEEINDGWVAISEYSKGNVVMLSKDAYNFLLANSKNKTMEAIFNTKKTKNTKP